MISEQKFATSFSSFWSGLTPLMDDYVRELNAGVFTFGNPVDENGPSELRGLFAEIAFELFATAKTLHSFPSPRGFNPKQVTLQSRHRIVTRLREQQAFYDFSQEDVDEIFGLTGNLLAFWDRKFLNETPRLRPGFKGCGILSECEGDMATDNHLVEVKSVNRRFQSADLRQILVYLALLHAAEDPPYRMVSIVNPRLAVSTSFYPMHMATEVSGMSLPLLLDEIILYMSDLSKVLIADPFEN